LCCWSEDQLSIGQINHLEAVLLINFRISHSVRWHIVAKQHNVASPPAQPQKMSIITCQAAQCGVPACTATENVHHNLPRRYLMQQHCTQARKEAAGVVQHSHYFISDLSSLMYSEYSFVVIHAEALLAYRMPMSCFG
jgi:hypothetical protein